MRNERYEKFPNRILSSSVVNSAKIRPFPQMEAELLRCIIAFEVANNRKAPNWTLAEVGLNQVNDDFFLFNEYVGHHRNDWIEEFCEGWKEFILEDADKLAIDSLPETERKQARVAKLLPVLLPLWPFFGSICHVLQEEENPLTPKDAYWLGLIDEVVGESLPTIRTLAEWQPADA